MFPVAGPVRQQLPEHSRDAGNDGSYDQACRVVDQRPLHLLVRRVDERKDREEGQENAKRVRSPHLAFCGAIHRTRKLRRSAL
jgi:hypothetical protein